ncbi:hypothetical protein GMRT_12595 [Giardia muris]|uniref:CCT domain-containing protein n=1 Tax=Giardia muris TaxID=5742 RepID=A0A4Z1T3D2_GIAMU|nr:hypothetical protein GMRT_12595 [Giardia muris]|eukprot:TNJ28463.1 hypothetical protein GMRT_12595 [Giardia muris]
MEPERVLDQLQRIKNLIYHQAQLMQDGNMSQELLKVRELFNATVDAIRIVPALEPFNFRFLASEVATMSYVLTPDQLYNQCYLHLPFSVTTIGNYTVQDRAALLTEYLQSRARRTLGKKCLYEKRRQIACDRPRIGGRFVKQKVDSPDATLSGTDVLGSKATLYSTFNHLEKLSTSPSMTMLTPTTYRRRYQVDPIWNTPLTPTLYQQGATLPDPESLMTKNLSSPPSLEYLGPNNPLQPTSFDDYLPRPAFDDFFPLASDFTSYGPSDPLQDQSGMANVMAYVRALSAHDDAQPPDAIPPAIVPDDFEAQLTDSVDSEVFDEPQRPSQPQQTNLQTISELTSSFSNLSADLGEKRRPRHGMKIIYGETTPKDHPISDVSLSSQIFVSESD